METTSDAEGVIKSIQRSYYLHAEDIAMRENDPEGVETKRQEEMLKSLEAILALLSTELYTDITHFILELIQNADDNTYAEVTNPTLRLGLLRDQLIVECNEVGFTENDVRAICKVNASTKKLRKDVIEGCIGEKGIGFKSVFSVSSKVCIYSNGFNFSFDKGCTLGMICPLLLSGASEYAKPGWTVFVLTLSINDADYETVRNALKEIHPEMLLFTRRLRQIEISTPAPSLSTAPTETRLYSVNVDVNDTFNEYTICSHSSEIKNLRYLREECDIFDMPEHPKRQEIRESKIVLAFPFNDSGPVISEQQIFAFMPLYRTPLPFLIQGDFLTQTSREGVLEQDSWNLKLRDSVANCFIAAISKMTQHLSLAPNFIEFIPLSIEHTSDRFLAPLVERILSSVKTMPIVRTRSGRWVEPSRAFIVPSILLFENEPLFSESELVHGGLRCSEYADSVYANKKIQSIIVKLGCPTITPNLVRAVISNSKFPFSEKSYAWLAALFRYLLEKSISECNSYRFLQLSDLSWTSLATHGTVYPPLASILDVEVPGLNIPVLHERFFNEITKIPEAEWFLSRNLKIAQLGTSDIVRAIINAHESSLESSLSDSICFQHAIYLARYRYVLDYNTKRRLRESFYVVDHAGHISKAHNEFVIDHKIQTIPPMLLSQVHNASSFRFLNKSYADDVVEFLIEILNIKHFPSLTESQLYMRRRKKKRWIEDTMTVPSSLYIEILCPRTQNNNLLIYYLADIWRDFKSSPGFDVLSEALRDMLCYCENGSLAPLSSCFLRTRHMGNILNANMNVLRLDSPDDPKWLFLRDLGVSLEPTLDLFIEELRQKKSEVADVDVFSRIDWFYKGLAVFCQGRSDDLQPLRDFFQREQLLVAKTDDPARPLWIKRDQVYRNCPSFIKSFVEVPDFKSIYYESLCEMLDLPSWNKAIHLKKEVESTVCRMQASGETWETIVEYVFTVLNEIAQEDFVQNCSTTCPAWVAAILKLQIFPVRNKHGGKKITTLGPGVFVPDSEYLNDHFRGKVDILDFGDHYIWDIIPVLKYSTAGLKYISEYRTSATVEVQILEPVAIDRDTLNEIWKRRVALTRLLYSRGQARSDGYDAINHEWTLLRIKIAHGLIQHITVPAFGISETQPLASHVSHEENSGLTIFVAANQEQSFVRSLIAQHLASHFNVQNLKGDISFILSTPEDLLSNLLSFMMMIPELPKTWMQRFNNEQAPTHLTAGLDLSDSDMSQLEADDIMQAIKVVLQDDGFHPRYVQKDDEMDIDITPTLLSLDTAVQSDDDTGIRGHNMKSGFAGEFYVDPAFKKRLITEFNWTSCLRKYAGFSPCEEGPSDFFYSGDIGALTTLFQLTSEQTWKMVYIEVKATTRPEKFQFHLSDRQFERAQEVHGTEDLYLIINVQNVLTKPTVSGVLDDPIRFLKDRRISFATTGGVTVKWTRE